MKKNQPRQQPRSKKISTRGIVQFSVLVLTVLIGLRHILPAAEPRGGSFDTFCPFGGVETLCSYLTVGTTLKTTGLLNFAILMGVLGMSLLSGRSFCGWICPLGTAQDYLINLQRRMNPSPGRKKQIHTPGSSRPGISPALDWKLRSLKYFVFGVILLTSIWSVFPPLREICPARALFSFQIQTLLLGAVLLLFTISSFLMERFSCRFLCPFGALLAPFNKSAPLRLTLNQNKCPGCGRCEEDCPMDIQDIPENLRSGECIQCLGCLERCASRDTLELRLG